MPTSDVHTGRVGSWMFELRLPQGTGMRPWAVLASASAASSLAMMASAASVWVSALGITAGVADADSPAPSRPNIVWITAEDMSATMGCYGDPQADTPHLDAMAAESTRYTHAFATSPVCSPSRACLINGLIATAQGTHPMRSEFPLPDAMLGFPKWLREAGYYTSNNVKTDYNSAAEGRIIRASWDANGPEADWRGRDEGQPFFAIFNLMTTHQTRTMVWPEEQFRREVQSRLPARRRQDPATVRLPPYYPDTPLVRRYVARYYDCVAVMDAEVGEILGRLRADGLEGDTIVFFYSDHGSGMPRHKRVLHDSGMHVPLLIRFPERFREAAPTAAGGSDDRLVSFEDFGPTVLSLAGVPRLPSFMRGRPFLGPLSAEPRDYVYGHRDRVDEAVDMARSIRSRDFLYIRTYMPHLSWNQPYAFGDQSPLRGEFEGLAASGEVDAAVRGFVSPRRPREALFDCQRDPDNLVNLIDSAEHRAIAAELRRRLRDELLATRDLGFVPEIEMWSHSTGDDGAAIPPLRWAQATPAERWRDRLRGASLVGRSPTDEPQVGDTIVRLFGDPDASVRYWAAVACSAAEAIPDAVLQRLRRAADDPSLAVRVEAAGALAAHGEEGLADETFDELLRSDDETVLLHTARTLERLGHPRHHPRIRALAERFENEPGDLAWFIRFSTSGYLRRVRPESAAAVDR